MASFNSPQGTLADTYGYVYGGGQRFAAWTNDAFNPTAWGVQTRMAPISAPELMSSANAPVYSGGGLSNVLQGVSPWSIIHSPVVWIIAAILVGIPLYHWLEYGK